MVRRKRDYKIQINQMRYQLYKVNQLLDVVEAALDVQHKPSYWNMKRLMTKLKKIQKIM